jgi:hypothetical protein
MAGSPKRRHVEYGQALVSYVDILGFGELIEDRSAGQISKLLRGFTEAVEPRRFKTPIPDVSSDEFITFSDLSITMIRR